MTAISLPYASTFMPANDNCIQLSDSAMWAGQGIRVQLTAGPLPRAVGVNGRKESRPFRKYLAGRPNLTAEPRGSDGVEAADDRPRVGIGSGQRYSSFGTDPDGAGSSTVSGSAGARSMAREGW
jgi:hypothetical protein